MDWAGLALGGGISLAGWLLYLRLNATTETRAPGKWRWKWLGGGSHYPWPRDVSAAESIRYQLVAAAVLFGLAALIMIWLMRGFV